MKRAAGVLGSALALAAVTWIAMRAWEQAADLPSLTWTPRRVLSGLAAVVLHLAALAMGAVVWQVLLRALGERVSLRRAWTLFGGTQIAKYLPGNIGHYLGRVALAARAGLDLSRVTVSILFEGAWIVLTGLCLAWLAWLTGGLAPQLADRLPRGMALAALMLGTIAGPLLATWAFRRLGTRLAAREANDVTTPRLGTLLRVTLLDASTFVLGGMALDILARGVFEYPASHLAAVIGIFAAAWVAGTVTPGAPGGLGVREVILVTSLEPIYGAPLALWLAIAHRLTGAMGDVFAFALAWSGVRRLEALPREHRKKEEPQGQ